MYINPVLVGVIIAVLFEVVAVVIYGITKKK